MYLKERIFKEECKIINISNLKSNYSIIENNIEKRENDNVILVNYGSYYTRAGLSNTKNSLIICPSITTRVKRGNEEMIISGNLLNSDNIKTSYKNIFETSIYNFKNDKFSVGNNFTYNKKLIDAAALEDFNDYIFNNLKLNSEKEKKIIFTELLGINKNRKINLELLFEAYEFDYVLPVCEIFTCLYKEIFSKIDIFDSKFYNDENNYKLDDGKIFFNKKLDINNDTTCFLIYIGNLKINLVPVLNGKILYKYIKRINLGINNCKNYLKNFLSLKFPHIKNKINNKVINLLTENFCYISKNYNAQLNYLKEGKNYFNKNNNKLDYINNNKIEDEFENPVFIQFLETEYEKLKFFEEKNNSKKKRQDQAKAMAEFMKQKKEEKKKENLAILEKYENLINLSDDNKKQFEEEIKLLNIPNKEVLIKITKNLKHKLGLISEEELNKNRFDLLDKDEKELTLEELKIRRIQVMQKQKYLNTLERREKKMKKLKKIEDLKKNQPEIYLKKLKEKRNLLKNKIKKIKSYKDDKNFYSYREKRIAYLNELFLEGNLTKEQLDNDPMIKNYEDNSDFEKFENKIFEIDNEIRTLEPNFEDEEIDITNYFANCEYIDFGIEACKTFEIFFKPYLIGNKQMGISELADSIISQFPINIQKSFLNNILIKGGGSLIKGISERIKNDLTKNSKILNPVINIKLSKNPLNECYENLEEIVKNPKWKEFAISRNEYEEKGAFYFKKFILSNI